MGNHRSAGSFCSIVVSTTTGAFDSVTSLNTLALGDGAECYCLANQALYRFSLLSTQTTVGDVFLQPSGGFGCWFKQGAQDQLSTNFYGTLSVFPGSIVITPQNLWAALPSVFSNQYSVAKSSLLWTINTTTGTMTYTGPDNKTFLFLGTTSVTGGAGAQQLQFDLLVPSQIGQNVDTPLSVIGTMGTPSTTSALELTSQVLLTALHGDVYQHAVRCTSASPGNIGFLRYSASIINIGN